MERNLTPVPAASVIAAQPAARSVPAAPGASVDVLATLLLGLVGGLVGGGVAKGLAGGRPRAARRTA